jgi:hypothetical protein
MSIPGLLKANSHHGDTVNISAFKVGHLYIKNLKKCGDTLS